MAEATLRQKKARIAKLKRSIEFWERPDVQAKIGTIPADRARRILRNAEAGLSMKGAR